MAGPFQIGPGTADTAIWPEASNVYIGPFVDANGNIYTVLEPVGASPRPGVYKSTNGGQTWTEMDAAAAPAWSSWGDLEGMQVTQGDQTLWMLNMRRSTSRAVEHYTFRTSDHATNPDTWGSSEVADSTTVTSIDQCSASCRRSDGDLVLMFRDNLVGSDDQLAWNVKNFGGAWGTKANIAVSGKDLTQPECCVGESDVSHLFVRNLTDGSILWYTLSAANVLSASTTLVSSGVNTTMAYALLAKPVYIDDGGTERIYVAWWNSSGGISGIEIVNGTPGSVETITTTAIKSNPGSTDSLGPVAFLTKYGKELHCFFSDSSTSDLWHTKKPFGGSWSAETEILDNQVIEYVNAAPITRSGSTVMGILISDNTAAAADGQAYYLDMALPATGPDPKTFTVTNTGEGTLNWTATKTQTWLSLSPTSGALGAGANAVVTVTADPAGLSAGTYNDTITVADAAASNTPQTVAVTFNVISPGTPISGSDSFVLSEGASVLQISATRTDTFSLTEPLGSLSVTLARSDSFALNEAASNSATISVSDSAALTELAALAFTENKAASDSLTLSELAVALSATISRADPFTLAEIASVLSTLSAAESHALSEAAVRESVDFKTASDSSTVSEVVASLTTTDFKTASETHTVTDSVSGLSGTLTATDLTTLLEASAINASLLRTETITATELASVAVTDFKTGSDSFAFVEGSPVIAATFSASDSFAFEETLAALSETATKTASEVFNLGEQSSLAVVIYITASDSATLVAEVAGVVEESASPYVHYRPPSHGLGTDMDLDGIVVLTTYTGQIISAVATGVVGSDVAAGVISAAVAGGVISDAVADGVEPINTTSGVEV